MVIWDFGSEEDGTAEPSGQWKGRTLAEFSIFLTLNDCVPQPTAASTGIQLHPSVDGGQVICNHSISDRCPSSCTTD